MKFLFVTYRYGKDIFGGAEIHHRRLVQDLIALGHDVEVWTTTGREIEPAAHWAVEWKSGYAPGRTIEDGVSVQRFALDRIGRKPLQIAAKLMQRQIEREALSVDPKLFAEIGARQPEAEKPWVHLLNNWHHVEISFDGYVSRWTYPVAHLAVYPVGVPGRLWISGNATRAVRFSVRDGSGRFHHFHESGHFEVAIPVQRAASGADVISIITEKPMRPLADHRSLGLFLNSVRWMPDGEAEAIEADLWSDHRSLGRLETELWWDLLWNQAQQRPAKWGKLFDWLRGPRSSALRNALRNPPADCDAVIAANLPWGILPMVANECPLPLLAMPLWHIEDDYYYWQHYIDALKKARLVLANTPFSAERFFKPRGMSAEFIGPGVPTVAECDQPFDIAAWRAAYGIESGEKVVLSVSRKSPEKRYGIIEEAVERLCREGRNVRFVLIGPDLDTRKVGERTIYLGRVSDGELDAAYRACDVFALMSDTESFGMVLAEAWLRGRPVIANERCGPAASLVNPGVDGLLAHNAETLARAVAHLIDNPEQAEAMGRAGKEKAQRDFVQRAATERLVDALKHGQVI